MQTTLQHGSPAPSRTIPPRRVNAGQNQTERGGEFGINENYTRGDRILAWSVFIWSFVFRFCIVFVGFIVWNLISPWPKHWWANWFWIDYIYVMGLNALITVFWFEIYGTRDLIRMFRRLDARTEGANILDDGRVEGHISAVDLAMVAKVEEESQAPSANTNP